MLRKLSIILLTLAAILLGWTIYAAPRWISGVSASAAVRLHAADFGITQGSQNIEADALRIELPAASSGALVWTRGPWSVDRLRFLTYRIDGTDAAHRMRLFWHREGKAYNVSLPRSAGRHVIDLSRTSADWGGQVDDLAFGFWSADLLPQSTVPAVQVELSDVELESDGYPAALRAMFDEWLAPRPWTGRSVNVTGLEMNWASPRPLLPALVWATACLLIGYGVLRHRRWRPSPWAVAGAALLAWIVSDVYMLRVQSQRLEQVGELRQLAGEQGLAAMPDYQQSLEALRDRLLHEGRSAVSPTVFIQGGGRFAMDYGMYLLRPLNVGPLPKKAGAELPQGSLLVRFGKPGDQSLRIGKRVYPLSLMQKQDGFSVFRIGVAEQRP